LARFGIRDGCVSGVGESEGGSDGDVARCRLWGKLVASTIIQRFSNGVVRGRRKPLGGLTKQGEVMRPSEHDRRKDKLGLGRDQESVGFCVVFRAEVHCASEFDFSEDAFLVW
jgi:hypothetical protein